MSTLEYKKSLRSLTVRQDDRRPRCLRYRRHLEFDLVTPHVRLTNESIHVFLEKSYGNAHTISKLRG